MYDVWNFFDQKFYIKVNGISYKTVISIDHKILNGRLALKSGKSGKK